MITAKLGLRRAVMGGWILLSLPVLSAAAPDFVSLLLLRLGYGLGLTVMVTATGPLLMQWFRPKEVLLMNGLILAIFSLGIALSVSTADPMADVVGWQRTLSIFGAPGVLGAVAWALLGRTTQGSTQTVEGVINKGPARRPFCRAVLFLVAADAGVLFQYTALSSWLPTFFHEVRDLSLAKAGFITGLLPFVGIFAVILGGLLPGRFGSQRIYFLVPGVLVGLGGLGTFLLSDLAGIYASVIILGLGSWLYVPTLMSLSITLPGMTPEKVAIVWGYFMTISGFGMFLSPLLVGGLRDITGSFIPGFAVCAVTAWTLLAAGVFMPLSESTPD